MYNGSGLPLVDAWREGGDMSLSGCQFGDWMSLRPVYPTHLSVVVVISQSTVYSVIMAK